MISGVTINTLVMSDQFNRIFKASELSWSERNFKEYKFFILTGEKTDVEYVHF